MHKHKRKLLFVRTAGFVGCGVECGCRHSTVNLCGVLCNKFLALGIATHCKYALEDGKDRVLVEPILVFGNLCSNGIHKVLAARNIVAEISFNPRLCTADYNNTLLKSLEGGCGNIGLAVIVYGITVKQSTHSNTGVAGAILVCKNALNSGVCGKCCRLFDLVHFQVGNGTNLVLESLGVKALGIKFRVRHNSYLTFL